MNVIHIDESYDTWKASSMKVLIILEAKHTYGTDDYESLLNRGFVSLYIEWVLHNIGYYLTKPFCKIPYVKFLNSRFRDVDLEEWTWKKH